MEVPQRILNSTRPFSMSMNQPKLKDLDCIPSNPEPQSAIATVKGDKQNEQTDFTNSFWKIISHGTAKHVGTGPLGTEKTSIIAQAECESQDSQEFCPNSRHKNATYSFSAGFSITQGSVPRHQPRKKRRKRQRRRETDAQQRNEGSDRVRERRLSRTVPEQDSEESEELSYTSSLSRTTSTESLSVQETTPESQCLSGSEEPDSPLFSEAQCSLALTGLRRNVTSSERCYASPVVKQMVRDWKDKEEEEQSGEERETSDTNEGIFFKEELQPRDYEYREGREYEVCNFIKQGSYGDVYSIRDKSSGFVCAAKKVPLGSFNSEEVGSWSALLNPHVVELFGFVREGPFIMLFMDLKPGSLGQLLAERGRLPEDLSLHYMQQVLGALEHLHKRRVLHLDIKVDNVLLSEDGKDTFLCDFGQSERSDQYGFCSLQDMKGTETHMAPEVASSGQLCTKADVWSSCCMLLHMLNGCQPWTRYYSRPLYLKIAEEPPPLREIPPHCSARTADVIKRGLQKDPSQRASAKDLRIQTAKALKELGGLRSPARGGTYQKPAGKPERSEPTLFSQSSVQQWMGPGPEQREGAGLPAVVKHKGNVEEVDTEKDKEEEIVKRNKSPSSSALYNHPPLPDLHKPTEQELRKLERDFFLSSLSQPHSVELQEQLLSCLGSDCPSTREPADKKDSGRWSGGFGEDLSSGVFSYNSQSEQSFSMDWLVPAHQPTPRCFEGVDVCIRDFNGRCFRIRETPRVNVGHIARGISDQISESVFSLQSEDGSLVPHDIQVQETGLFLRCVPAPDCTHAPLHRHGSCCKTPWSWRIKDGVLETRD